jgi:aminoglycoside 6'-N-acetyltransferase I
MTERFVWLMKNSSKSLIIVDLVVTDENRIRQAAQLLVLGFRENWPGAWPDLPSAITEVDGSLKNNRISRIAINESGDVIGWIGGIRQYGGHAWELHPLVVHPSYQGKGIGTALVNDLEQQIVSQGGTTIWIGTDDETEMTSIGGIDLYPEPLVRLLSLRNLRGHPFEFYQKLGFSIVGVIPDANGPGKPDILMAKRIGAS